MKDFCAHEAVVSAAVQSGRWDEETAHHVALCIRCSEVIRAAEWTRSLAAEPHWPPLRDPDLLWIEARLLSARMKRERTMQMFAVLESICILLVSAGAANLILNRGEFSGLFSEVLNWFRRLGNLGPWTIDFFSPGSALMQLTLLLIAITFLIHPFLLEE